MTVERTFPPEEHQARVARVRHAMAERGLDGLLLAAGPNLAYLSGYPSPSRAGSRPFVFLLPLSGDPVLIVHTGRELEARAYSWVADVRTYAELSHAPLSVMEEAFRDAGLTSGRVGAEIGAEAALDLPLADFLAFQAQLPDVAFVDAGPALWSVRMVKSPAEAALVRAACAITAEAYRRAFADAREGMSENEIARTMAIASLKQGGSAPWTIVTSGPGNYDLASKLPSDRRLERGDLLWMDCGCAVGGYWSDFGRAGVVGGPSAAQRDAQARIHEITMRAVDMVRPGVTTGEIARACNAELARLDLPITSCISGLASRIGHGLGLLTTELPHVAEDDETVLEPGMILTLEPGIATEYGTFHVEENVLVTDDGHEVLSNAPRELATIAGG